MLVEEYRALYGLAQYRMASLERRIPLFGAALTGFVASVAVISAELQLAIVLGLPPALLLFVKTTINHARSFEDLLRRIEQIERAVNTLAGKDLMMFQSSHPSRGRSVGGRIGAGSVVTIAAGSALLLAGCVFLALNSPLLHGGLLYASVAYLLAAISWIVIEASLLQRYRYRHRRVSD